MNINIDKVDVYYNAKKVGVLKELKDSRIAFQYELAWLEEGFSISPFSLPLEDKVFISNSPYFKGLFGVFNDSLPDGFGEFLVRRMLLRKKIDFDKISPLVRLTLLNINSLGGLDYIPSQNSNTAEDNNLNLDFIKELITNELIDYNANLDIDSLYNLGGASGGARPKVHLKINNEEWIIKFPALNEKKDVGLNEYHTNELARLSGINVNQYKLFESNITNGFFGAKRFDRKGTEKIHTISLAAILETTHKISNLDYFHLFQVIEQISVDKSDIIEAYKRMVFNVLYNNKDDHSKNHSFIYDESKGGYVLSKAYDLTKTKDKLEHEITVNGKGNPDEKDLLEFAEKVKISKKIAVEIIDKIKKVISE